jgi:hypothetical protein
MCGEVIGAASDEELVGALRSHMDSNHPDSGVEDEHLRGQIASGAYTATDS